MRIVFLGTSHGYPEPGKRCSSTLIEVGESRYIIDMGTQAVEDLIARNIPLASVKAVFVTHLHGDHTNGLLSFVDVCSWKFKNSDPIIYLPGDTENARECIRAWLACNGTPMRPFDFRSVQEGVLFEDGVIRVTAYRTKHMEHSYAYLVEAEGKRVLFSGDLSAKGPQEDFPVAVLDEPLDLAICECAHFEATEYLPLFEGKGNLKSLCFNHTSERFLHSVLEVKAQLTHIPVIRLLDGMEITV